MSRHIVRERSDGRGGMRPFGTYGKKQAGGTVQIGAKKYKITKDGRVNIPKKIIKEYGVKGKDGRLRIEINFSSKKGVSGWLDLAATVSRPHSVSKDLGTGVKPMYTPLAVDYGELGYEDDMLLPDTEDDYTWT